MDRSIGVAVLVVSLIIIGCQNKQISEELENKYYELTIENESNNTIFVDIVSEDFTESIGVLGPESGKGINAAKLSITYNITVRWGIEGEDGIKKEHVCIFNTEAYAFVEDKIKAVEIICHSDSKWELKVYDSPISFAGKLEVMPSVKNYDE